MLPLRLPVPAEESLCIVDALLLQLPDRARDAVVATLLRFVSGLVAGTGGPSPSCCTSDSSSGSLAPSAPRSPSGFLCTKGVSAWLNGSVTCEKSATPGPRPLNHSKCCARAEDGCQQGGHACGGGGFRMHAHLLATVLAHAVRAGIVVVAARKAAPIAQPRFLRSLGLTVRVGRRRHCRLEQWGSGLHDPGRNDDGGPWNIVRNSGHWPSHSKGR